MVSFTLEVLAFLAFIITVLYLPGRFLLSLLRLKTPAPQEMFVSIAFGFLVFTFVSYVFAWLKADTLLLPFFLILDIFAVKYNQWKPSPIQKEHVKPLILVGILAVLFSTSMLVTGKFGDTLIYRHDDPWHLALINELKAHFPPDNPAVAGVPLKGYHFFYNFVVAKISNLFFISPLSLHFHLFPLFTAFLWAFGVYSLMIVWTKKISTSLWAVFLSMFGGSFAFILVLQGHPEVSLNSGLGIQQPAFSLYNPPFAISIIIMTTALFATHEYLTTKQKLWLIPLAICTGLVAMFKVYAGILLIGGLLLLTLFSLLKKRWSVLFAPLATGILFFYTYQLFNVNAGYLIWHPWWPPHTLLQSFEWYGYDEKIYTYTRLSVIKGLVETELYGFTLFILGNLGTRAIGLLVLFAAFIRKPHLPSVFSTILGTMALAGLLIPLLFLQSGKVFEIIQIAMYYLFLCSLFAAIGLSKLFSFSYPKIIKALLFIIIILLTLPSAYETFRYNYIVSTEGKNLNTPYFQALEYLSQQDTYTATVLEVPPQGVNPDKYSINGWFNASDAIVTALANKRSYLNNEFIVFRGVDLETRMTNLEYIVRFATVKPSDPLYGPSFQQTEKILRENNIRFILSHYDAPNFTNIQGVKEVYKNGSYRVYKVE